MHLIDDRLKSNLKFNTIKRGEDLDVFLQTNGCVIDAQLANSIQFVGMRAILVRLGVSTEDVTVHILQDTDLYSSIANFELDLKAKRLYIYHDEENNKIVLKRAV